MFLSVTNLCHVEPQADGFALFEKKVELLAVKQIIQVMPQSFQNMMGKLYFLTVPACQSMGAPVEQSLQENLNKHILAVEKIYVFPKQFHLTIPENQHWVFF